MKDDTSELHHMRWFLETSAPLLVVEGDVLSNNRGDISRS